MAEQNVKKIRIPIEDGLFTFGSGYEIGPRLRHYANIQRYWQSSNGVTSFPFGLPDVPDDLGGDNVTLGAGDCEVINGMGILDCVDGTFYLGGGNSNGGAKPKHIYDLELGTEIPVVGPALGNGSTRNLPYSFAFAPNLSEPTTFVVHQDMAKRKVQSGPAVNQYLPTPFDPDGQPGFHTNPKFCYYHLNRLWLAYGSTDTRRTLVFFSDPLDPDLIRGTNFLDIPDQLLAIFRTSASDIDLGAQAHLVFACRSSLYVLDGDPTQGNAVFRQLKKSIGIVSAHHHVETTEGAVLLMSDNRFYLMPRGAQDPVPIDEETQGIVTDRITIPEKWRIGWKPPYLYVLGLNPDQIYTADLRDVKQGVKWFGPHYGAPGMWGILSDIPFTTKCFMPFASPAAVAQLSFAGNFKTKLWKTGYVFEPDADVAFLRVVLDVQKLFGEQTIIFRVHNLDGLQEEFTLTVPGTDPVPLTTEPKIAKVFATTSPLQSVFGDFFWVELEGSTLYNVRNWNVSYRVEPRKD